MREVRTVTMTYLQGGDWKKIKRVLEEAGVLTNTLYLTRRSLKKEKSEKILREA